MDASPIAECDPPRVFFHPPVAPKNLQWITIFDIDSWEGCCYAWMAPVRQRLAFPGMGGLVPAVRPCQTTGVTDLLRLAAEHGFWNLPMLSIKSIAAGVGVEIPSDDLFSSAWALVKSITQASDEECLGFMQNAL